MEVKSFDVGPILGNVTVGSAYIFGRGNPPSRSSLTNSFGVCRIREEGASEWSLPITRFQQPHFDYSSVSVVNGLSPSATYQYQCGYIHVLDGEEPDLSGLLWDRVKTHQFKTPSDNNDDCITFAFGSCRYLLKFFFGSIFDSRGDKIFASMAQEGLDQVLMLGDQIYADDLNIIGADDSIDEFLKRYRDVFSQPNFSKLVASTPTYMTLDDHEIEDNWPENASRRDMIKKYPAAMHAYKIYQMSHSPAATLNKDKTKIANVSNVFWYTMVNGCSDFFVMDVRTQRHGKNMVNPIQLQALFSWLNDGSGRIKFIASSVPFFPDYSTSNDDKWSGYQTQRNQILAFIKQHKITKVVFLSGDVHASMAAELTCDDDPDFKVISIVSSPFFWPYPHPNQDTFALSGTLQGNKKMKVKKLIDVFSDENYGKITASLSQLKIEMKDRKGQLKASKIIKF